MLAWLRGQSTPIEVPDQPASTPAATTPVLRSDAPVTSTQATTDHAGTDTTVDHSTGLTITYSSPDSFPPFNPITHDAQSTITVDTHAAGATIVNSPAAPDIQWFAHTDTLPSFAPVPSVVTDISAPLAPAARGGDFLGDSGGSGDAGGSVFRGGGTLASLAIDSSGYGDHGWFIVPSASAEYGDAHFDVAGADGFEFNVAAGEFTSDWFLV